MADSIMRWDPFRDLVSIQDKLHRLFGRTFRGAQLTRSGATGSWMPAVDVYETQDKAKREETKPRKIEAKATA